MNRMSMTVTRYANGGYVDGRYVAGASSTFSILASAQPITGKDLQYLPEGRRTSEAYYLFTDTLLQTAMQSGCNKADEITAVPGIIDYPLEGTYEVVSIEAWRNNILNHYKVTVIKK